LVRGWEEGEGGREGGTEGRSERALEKEGREVGVKPPLFWLNLGVDAMACIYKGKVSNNQMKCK